MKICLTINLRGHFPSTITGILGSHLCIPTLVPTGFFFKGFHPSHHRHRAGGGGGLPVWTLRDIWYEGGTSQPPALSFPVLCNFFFNFWPGNYIFKKINCRYFFYVSKFIKELSKLWNHLHPSGMIHSQSKPSFHILNPRALMRSLWASVGCPQCSPFSRMHTSCAFLVSGQAQQGFSGSFFCISGGAGWRPPPAPCRLKAAASTGTVTSIPSTVKLRIQVLSPSGLLYFTLFFFLSFF